MTTRAETIKEFPPAFSQNRLDGTDPLDLDETCATARAHSVGVTVGPPCETSSRAGMTPGSTFSLNRNRRQDIGADVVPH